MQLFWNERVRVRPTTSLRIKINDAVLSDTGRIKTRVPFIRMQEHRIKTNEDKLSPREVHVH